MPSATADSYVDLFDYAAQPLTRIVCPVCGADNPSRPRTDRYGYAIGLSRCPCGLAYLNPRMSAAQYVTFYQTAYRPLASRFCQIDTTGPIADRASRRRGRLIGHTLANGDIRATALLDVGGGSGVATREIAAALQCPSVTVVDPNADDIRVVEREGGIGLLGTPETLPPLPAQYDLILSLQTADHWLDPLTVLRWMRAACRTGGHLWIDIVDVVEREKRTPRACHWKIDHPLYWSSASVLRALAQTGWRARQRYHETHFGRPKWHRPAFFCEGV